VIVSFGNGPLCYQEGRHVNRTERRGTLASILVAMILMSGCNPGSGTDGATDPANELPSGRVDLPLDGAQVAASVPVGGWALDDRGIKEVRLYVDGHFQIGVPLNTDRPDVSKAFPTYAKKGDRHGWTTAVSFEAPGPHTVVVQAVDSDGATRDIGVLTLTSR
jgi:hypothetical protein